jgi:hypothetical protein
VGGAVIDALAELMRPDAIREIRQATHNFPLCDLTALEMLSLLTTLRQVRTRIEAEKAAPARVLKMVQNGKRRNRLA